LKLDKRVRLALVIGAIGCSRHPTSCGARSSSAPSAATSAEVAKILKAELPPEDAGDATMGEAFIELVRREAWDDAAASLDGLSEEKKKKPTVRLVRGRVAMARGDWATAVQAFEGLEAELSPVAEDIEKWRADAASHVGPYALAAQYYAKQSGPKSLVRAALAYQKAGMLAEARSAADKAIGAGRGDASEIQARALRAELAKGAGQNALAIEDLRFIVVRAPASDEAKNASSDLETLDPSHPLTGRERLVRAERFVEAGRTDDALAELDRAEKSPNGADADDVAWARAFALYKSRGRYEKAAAAFTRLGQKSGKRQPEALYYAARAASRADHDDEAASGYRAVARRFPTSPWADESSYLAARLSFLHAAWAEAAAGYAAYLRKFPSGKQHDAAGYERALALLADGKYQAARSELHALAQATTSAGEAARLRELEGLAASKAGDKEGATALFTDVVRAQPLSWAAMAARARLAKQGVELPPALDPPESAAAEPMAVSLPPIALLYHRLGLDGDAESWLRAHERDAVADLKAREKEALCAMYGELGRAARLYRVGVDAVPSALLARAPSPSSEWGWRCVYPRPYLERVRDIEERESLPKGLIYAVMRQESAFDPDAVSGARAVGLLQLMPDTARRLASEMGTPFDERLLRAPATNLDLGGRYLAKLLHSFNGAVPMAAAAYNAGPKAVRRWLDRMKSLDTDLWVAMIPFEETRTYVSKVMSNLARYSYLEGGEGALPLVDLMLPSAAPTTPTTTKEETAEY
jgi:soluble lytic murein transglycosylase